MSRVDVEPTEPAGPGEQAPDESVPAEIIGRSPGELFRRRFRKDKWALAGIVIIAIIGLLALTAPLFAKWVGHPVDGIYVRELTEDFPPGCSTQAIVDPTNCSTGFPLGPTLHTDIGPIIFGADDLARDLFIQVLYGARTSLEVALTATVIEMFLGVASGILAGFYRGKIDTFISRLFDIFFALPTLLLMLGISAACGAQQRGQECLGGLLKPGKGLIIVLLGFFSWPYIGRIIRGQVLSIREKEFVEAARSLGASNFRIMVRDILPNVIAPIIVYTTLIIPTNILAEAALSFLGLGVPPDVASWGAQIDSATANYRTAWWTMVFPGLFLFMTTLAFNLVGDGLRDAFDPKTA
ncbi:MAG: ABC transporter permease [Actinomycetota bacterium]